jgi:hypothetical protein
MRKTVLPFGESNSEEPSHHHVILKSEKTNEIWIMKWHSPSFTQRV